MEGLIFVGILTILTKVLARSGYARRTLGKAISFLVYPLVMILAFLYQLVISIFTRR